MSSSPPHGYVGEPSTRESGNGSSRSRRRRRRRPPTPPPPPQEEPSTSTYNINGGVWPEPFVEALATQVALDATRSLGRLAAAPAVAFLFQVCATWRTVSRSELLWQNLVRLIWNRTNLLLPTWRDEYIYHHRTARNFRQYHCSYATLRPSDHHQAPPPGDAEAGEQQLPLFCVRLALSEAHLAAGFCDGSVRLFHLPTRFHLRTVHPLLRDHLGPFSRAVSGISLLPQADRLVFASLDGDVHVVSPFVGPDGVARRAYLGDVVNDGALVDFAGSDRFWVGLYAGVPGRAVRVWDAESEELLFVGLTFTDPEAVMGWRMLTELRPNEPVGRVRVLDGLSLCFTVQRVFIVDLEAHAMVLREEAARRGIVVGSVDAVDQMFVMVDTRGVGSVRRTPTLQEVCRLDRGPLRGAQLRGLLGCINSLYVLMCAGGAIRVWDAEHGGYLYSFRERVGNITAITISERHVVASTDDMTIHLWDFGA